MAYDFSILKKELKEVETWLAKEFTNIRTGRATPTLLDGIFIDSYGTKSQVSHVAGITTEDARTLRVAPWDKGHVKEIEKAIAVADLGVSVSVDDAGLRVSFPELTSERREMLGKIVGEKIEHAKVSMRQEREKAWSGIQTQEKNGEISEDEKFKFKDELQKVIDETNKTFEEMGDKKRAEIAQ
ncbi:MAG: ribosome recycling factor [Candidatus Pacebacteria bacterium]|nr:ribosome recycling factor [Candidatus Paceibacterota bacterium]